jgi:Tol biopolymer transport system component
LLDRIHNTNTLICPQSMGIRAGLKFSANADTLVYAAVHANVVGDTNGMRDVYIYDHATGTNTLISRRANSSRAGNGPSDFPDISADGRYVVYQSLASDLVPFDNPRSKDIFLYDRQAGETVLLSSSAYATRPANLTSLAPRFTGDGQTVMFLSWASDLIEGDFNQGADVFVVKLASGNPIAAFSGQIIYVPGSGQLPTILWPATNGVTYEVQFKDELTDPAWLSVNGTVIVVGNQGSVVDLAPNPSHRFYRIVAH